jgi:hypothetical protein
MGTILSIPGKSPTTASLVGVLKNMSSAWEKWARRSRIAAELMIVSPSVGDTSIPMRFKLDGLRLGL